MSCPGYERSAGLAAAVGRRFWRRWRSHELLWGTHYERFWPQWMVWRKEDALIWWVLTQCGNQRRKMLAYAMDPKWAHIRFIRLTSRTEIERFATAVESEAAAEAPR